MNDNYPHNANAFSDALSLNYFKDKRAIRDEEIKQVSPCEQVNVFVFKNIYQDWKLYFDSTPPYFDYKDNEVQDTFNVLRNQLTKHIHIDKLTFQKLLKRAVKDTLILLFRPQYFYKELSYRFSSVIHIKDDVLPLLRYVQLHKEYQEAFIEHLFDVAEDGYIERSALINSLNSFSFYGEFQSITPILNQLDEVIKVKQDDIFPNWRVDLDIEIKSPHSIEDSKISLSNSIPLNKQFDFCKELFREDIHAFSQTLKELEQVKDHHLAIELLKKNYAPKYDWDMHSDTLIDFYTYINTGLNTYENRQ